MKFLMPLIALLISILLSYSVRAEATEIKKIYDKTTLDDSRYYPHILYFPDSSNQRKQDLYCPLRTLKVLSQQFDFSNIINLETQVIATEDLIEPLKHWDFSPECFDTDIHYQKEISTNPIQGLSMGIVLGLGESLNVLGGIEIVLVTIDSNTLSVGLFAYEGAGLGLSATPANAGITQGLLQGNCPDGVHSYTGGFTNVNIGSDSWSFATGDFPPDGNKLYYCSAYVKLKGTVAFSSGASQTFYHLLSPKTFKVRGPKITKLIAWLKQKTPETTLAF